MKHRAATLRSGSASLLSNQQEIARTPSLERGSDVAIGCTFKISTEKSGIAAESLLRIM
jgi:hypothetical protein